MALSEIEKIREHLERAKRRIQNEIRRYPSPIPACDAHFNYLLEQRERIGETINRTCGATRESVASGYTVTRIEELVAEAALFDDTARQEINTCLSVLRIPAPRGDSPYMVIISVTRLRLRANRYLLPFIWFATLSTWQARRAPGHLKIRLLRDVRRTFWTLTAWESLSAMRAFTSSGTHRRAMRKLPAWCDEASVVHWAQGTTDLPDWQQAHQRMVDEGRLSKVHHPSTAHQAGKIAAPFSTTP